MRMRVARLFCVGTVAALAAVAIPATGANAATADTPVVTGCPAGYAVFAVGTFPYRVAGLIDDPANGGNGDGYVCAHQLPDAVRDAFCARGLMGFCFLQELGLPAYLFKEDDSPAQGAP